ncbi:MAG TPA: DbpA RNA binding domain-containing protein, partial [Gemmatimonadaceae bacterium]|nr:DbpA RNA binding domain-containing protein [Gemmatimonadaceae bacterium]
TGGGEALESLMAEAPKETARTVVATRLTSAVEGLIERYARRAGRRGATGQEEGAAAPTDLRYVTVTAASRPGALRRVLDDLDPESAAIYVRSDEGERQVHEELRALALEGSGIVSVTRGEPIAGAKLVVLYEPPGTPAELRALAGERAAVVALAQPRQLEALRAVAAGGRVSPLTLSGPEARARGREEAVRAELRAALAEGAPSREILALEPLLAEFDGIELAAAALRLLERERERPGRREAAQAEPAAPSPWTRVFVTVGAKDGATPRDLVGAIANEAKIASDKIGKIELRDTHSLVEVASDAAEHVVKSIHGIMIRGRQVAARLDREPARRESSRREPTRREPARRERGDRPRSGPGGFRRAGDERREERREPRPPRRRDD